MPKPFRPNKKGKQPSKSLHTPAYERIRTLMRDTRYAADFSQEELGEKLGREQIYVSRCESGRAKPIPASSSQRSSPWARFHAKSRKLEFTE